MPQVNKNITALCRNLNFGALSLDEKLTGWQRAFNDEITLLCRGLPASQQASALMFLMRYSGITIGAEMNFFKNYYHPSWTILAHVVKKSGGGKPENFPHFIRAHAMAMFLHSLEDHMTDAEIRTDNLTLLLHGEAWRRYRNSLDQVCGDDQNLKEVVDTHLDRYFSSIGTNPEDETLEGYCDHFRDQMATTTLVVSLLAIKTPFAGQKTGHIIKAFECFGIAWRLLDDLNDLEKDIPDGTKSALYYLLEEQWRNLYDLQESPRDSEEILKYLAAAGTLKKALLLTINFLDRGAEAAGSAGITLYKSELTQLSEPLRKAGESL